MKDGLVSPLSFGQLSLAESGPSSLIELLNGEKQRKRNVLLDELKNDIRGRNG